MLRVWTARRALRRLHQIALLGALSAAPASSTPTLWQVSIPGATLREDTTCFTQPAPPGFLVISGDGPETWLLDPEGRLLAHRVPVPGLALVAVARETSTDGTLVLVGSAASAAGTRGAVVAVDPASGDFLWRRGIGCAAGATALSSIVSTPDGGFLLAGETDCGFATSRLLLVKVDSAWTIEWEKTYAPSLSGSPETWRRPRVTRRTPGGYLVAAAAPAHTSDSSSDHAALVVDAQGDVLGTSMTQRISAVVEFMRRAGGQLWARLEDHVFVDLDEDGNNSIPGPSWRLPLYSGGSYASSTSDGGVLLVGQFPPPVGEPALSVMRYDGMESLQSARLYGAPDPSARLVGVAVAELSDGVLAVGVETPSRSLHVLRLGSSLRLGARCSLEQDLAPWKVALWTTPIVATPDITVAVGTETLDVEPTSSLEASVTAAVLCLDSASCSATMLEVRDLSAVRRRDDVALAWTADLAAPGYNVWHVDAKEAIDRARASSAPPAVGVPGCSVPVPSAIPACTDVGAVSGGAALRFYAVRSSCDANTEGP